jgi:hypothetical protein
VAAPKPLIVAEIIPIMPRNNGVARQKQIDKRDANFYFA